MTIGETPIDIPCWLHKLPKRQSRTYGYDSQGNLGWHPSDKLSFSVTKLLSQFEVVWENWQGKVTLLAIGIGRREAPDAVLIGPYIRLDLVTGAYVTDYSVFTQEAIASEFDIILTELVKDGILTYHDLL